MSQAKPTAVLREIMREVLGPECGVDALGDEDSIMDSLAIDSVAAIEVLIVCEQRFNCHIPDKELSVKLLSCLRELGDRLSAWSSPNGG